MSLTDSRLEGHLHEAVIENIGFLMDSGYSFELACLQIGKSPTTVEKLFDRHGLPNPANKEIAS